MREIIEKMASHTDCWPWYWVSYGEKCYAFATVEAYPLNESDPIPEPGSELEMDERGNWIGNNNVEMIIETEIATIEKQNGNIICQFIAGAHAKLMKDYL